MQVLVTGGAGYIGSHTCVELMQAGHEVGIFDHFSGSHAAAIARIARIVGRTPEFTQADVRDSGALREVFIRHRFDAVIHFAGLKAVGESVEKPIEYYDNNVHGALVLCRAMAQAGVGVLVFSSSATVYGNAASVPTRDGTGVRDYIHVVDLARGHLAALETMQRERRGMTVNLGTGRGVSVLETVRAFERASGRTVPFERVARRAGDVAECYADPSLAEKILGWTATYTLEAMCRDTWRWQSMNPHGYREESRK